MQPKKQVIVITGATRGLGLALAKEYAAMGHTVVGCGRNAKHVDFLRNNPGPAEYFSVVDVADARAVDKWAAEVTALVGAPNYVLNNAALINENVPFWQINADEFNNIIDVNIKGVANVMRAFLPAMLLANHGIIVNLSSGYGHTTAPGVSPYCCSKFAIEGLTRAVADELPKSLAAIPLNPGIINTDMLQKTFGKEASSYESPDSWAKKAAPYILKLRPTHNGKSLRIP